MTSMHIVHWLSNIGKALLTFAGLVAILDVAGRDRVEEWARRARYRYAKTSGHRRQLRLARDLVTTDRASGAGAISDSYQLDDAHLGQFLTKQRKALEYVHNLLEHRRRWTVPMSRVAVGSTIWLAVLIGLMGWLFSHRADVAAEMIVVAFVGLAGVAMVLTTVLLLSTIQAWLMWRVALARLRLAKTAVKAFGKKRDGQPIRAVALIVFIVGSVADLAGSWSSG